MTDQYTTGEYWEKNAGFHEEDSDFKFRNFLTLLQRNTLPQFSRIVDMGCGAGRITWHFADTFPGTDCLGTDLDPGIIAYANSKYKRSNLVFEVGTAPTNAAQSPELVVLADVFEHVEDYIGFLQKIRDRYAYQLFNIPLDLSVRTLLKNGPITARNTFGHLHFFYDKTALRALADNGFKVIDYLYTDNIAFDISKQKGLHKIPYYIKSRIARFLAVFIGQSKTSVLFGFSSLAVLCERDNN